MKKAILTLNELLEQVEIEGSQFKTWERQKLVRADGISHDGIPFYTEITVERIVHIKKLLGLGYSLEDIQKILKKVGLPHSGSGKKPSGGARAFLTIGGLAESVGVSPRAIKHWEDKGIIEPDMRSEGGFRLYSKNFVSLCQLIKDLQLFGYSLDEIKAVSDMFRDFLTISGDLNAFKPEENENKLKEMQERIDMLFEQMDLLKKGINRWEDLLKKKKKEISALRNQNAKRKLSKGKK